ncbi:MAG: hypothetical protein ACLTSX_06690 [Collinsella sp.]
MVKERQNRPCGFDCRDGARAVVDTFALASRSPRWMDAVRGCFQRVAQPQNLPKTR